MCIFWGLEIIMFLFVLMAFRTTQKQRNIMFAFVCMLWTMVWGFRAMQVGNDTISYADFFYGKNGGFYGTIEKPITGLEPGFLFIMRIVLTFVRNPTAIFTLQSAFMFYVIYKLYTRVNPKFAIWSLLFFFVVNWSYITLLSVAFRQAISVSLLLYGIFLFDRQKEKYAKSTLKWYKRKQLLISFIILFFAAFTHKSTLLFIPLIIATFYIRFSKFFSCLAIVITFSISIFFSQLIAVLFDFAMMGLGESDSEMISMFGHYSGTIDDSNNTLLSSVVRTIIYTTIVLCTEKKNVGTVYFNNLVICACMFNFLSFSLQAGRILFVFALFSGCVYIPLMVEKNKLLRTIFIAFTLLYMYRSYSAFNNWTKININDTTLPYKFVWE